MLPVPAKRVVNGWNKHALDRCSSKDLTSNSSQSHLLNEHGDLSFLLHISDHYIVGNQRNLKKILCQLLLLRNHLNSKLGAHWECKFHSVCMVTLIYSLLSDCHCWYQQMCLGDILRQCLMPFANVSLLQMSWVLTNLNLTEL